MGENRKQTVRQELVNTLMNNPMSTKAAASVVGIRETDVLEHVKHIEKSGKHDNWRLRIMPAECRKCGFIFENREKHAKPTKCPECRGTYIAAPAFWIEPT